MKDVLKDVDVWSERGDALRIGQGVADQIRDGQIVEAAHPRSHDSPLTVRSRSSR